MKILVAGTGRAAKCTIDKLIATGSRNVGYQAVYHAKLDIRP